MENKIHTAEEFLNSEEYYSVDNTYDTQVAMIKFAKMHVQKALLAACEKGEVYIEMCMGHKTGCTWVDDDSIINSYPLTNIK